MTTILDKIALLILFSSFLLGLEVVENKKALAITELATVNGKIITLEEFNSKYHENLRFFQLQKPSKKKVLDDLIRRELGVQEALRQGLDRDPEIQNRINTVLYHALLEKTINQELKSLQVNDEEAKAYYSTHPVIRTSHIFLGIKKDASQAEVLSVFKKMKILQMGPLKKMSFSEVAQKYSEGPSAPMGGDIDYQTQDKLDATYYETALKLQTPGKVSNIIRTPQGLHIIQLTAIKTWDQVDHGEVKRRLFEKRRTEILEKFMNSLQEKSKVSIHPELITELSSPNFPSAISSLDSKK